MLGIVLEDRRILRPVLIELRGELDEVARGRSSGEAGVLGVGEHAVQGVSELVEHGANVVGGEQRGLARRRLGEVADVDDDRLGAHQLRLLDEVVHPGAALLVVALEVVDVEQGEGAAVGVEDLEDAHVGVVDRKVLALLEGNAVELGGGVEDAVFEHVVHLEVGLDLLFVEIVFGFAHLLGIDFPVKRLELESALLLVDDFLNVFGFDGSTGGRSGDDGVHELQGRFRRSRHLVVDLPCGKVGIAEQLGLLGAKLGDLGDGVAGVVGIAVLGTVPGIAEERLAGLAVGQVRRARAAGSCSAAGRRSLRLCVPWRLRRQR